MVGRVTVIPWRRRRRPRLGVGTDAGGPRGYDGRSFGGRYDEDVLAVYAGAASAAAAEVTNVDSPAPDVVPDSTAAAFFDVDNTMMVGASIFHFARGLAQRKFFSSGDLAQMAWSQLKFRVGGRENHFKIELARERGLAFVAGREVAEIQRYGEEIYDELMAERIWSGTRAMAEAHVANGQRVWLVTATPVVLADIIARRLGLTGALGTVAEIEDGRFTGRLHGEMLHGPAKAEAIRALAEREGLDLSRCTAYSDSFNDMPMLTAVGHAMAINPDHDLRNEARRRGWPMRDFRTARKAAKVGLPAVAIGGAVAGATLVALSRRRRRRT